MENLSMSDIYQVRANYELDHENYRVLYQLYQPLIGHEAVSLYVTLYSEMNTLTLTKKPALISRLSRICELSLLSLTQSFSKLEAVGLISTYTKKQENRYLFDMKQPLTAQAFIHHKILNTMLKQRLHHEYDNTVLAFQVYNVSLDQYDDVSASFTDIFACPLDQDIPTSNHTYRHKDTSSIEQDYDLTLFYQGLESLQLSKQSFQPKDIELIQQLGMLYKVNSIDMLDIVKTSMVQDRLDRQLLMKSCRDYYDLKMPDKFEEIFHKHSPLLQQVQGQSSLDHHIHYLENISPYDLLKDKLGGKEPVKRDLQVIESILTHLELEPGVMNVLIELTLAKCDQSLPRNFIEALASQWKRKNINTVKDAIEEGKVYMNYQSNQNDGFTMKHIKTVNEQTDENNNEDGDLMELMETLYK